MHDTLTSPPLLEWKVLLARRNPARAVSVAILIIICAYFVFFTTRDMVLTIIATIVLIMMVLPYYLSITYILTDDTIIKKMPLSRKVRRWDEFHRYHTEKGSIKLFTLTHPSRLDNYRSFLLICNKNKKEVLAIVQQKISSTSESSES